MKISIQKEKILQFIDYKGISKNKFYIKTGISNGVLDKKSSLSMNTVEKIYSAYPEINPEWLITGEGEMIKSMSTNELNESAAVYNKTEKTIPLISVEAVARLTADSISISEQDTIANYSIPDFINVDFMIRINESSMSPKYNSGDIVACRIINQETFIQWNKVHVIATKEQGVLVKRLKKGKDNKFLLAISDNKNYDSFEIPKDEIVNIALITGVIRLE